MLYVNDTLFNRSNKDYEKLFNDYQKKIDELRKHHGDVITFVATIQPYVEQVTRDGKGRYTIPAKLPMQSLSFRKQVYEEGYGEVDWRWTDSPRNIKDGKYNLISDPRVKLFQNMWVLPFDKYSDLIYFIVYKTNWVGGIMRIKDAELEAKKKISNQIPDSDLMYMVSSVNSPIAWSKDDGLAIRMLALSWGVNDAESLKEYQLKDALIKKVRQYESDRQGYGKGIQEFIDEAFEVSKGNVDSTKIKAAITKAIEKKLIKYDDSVSPFVWRWEDSNRIICNVPVKKFKARNDVLYDYISTHEEEMKMLMSSTDDKYGTELTEAKIASMSWPDFVSLCKDKDVYEGKTERDVLHARLITKLGLDK